MRLEINWSHKYMNSPEFVVHTEIPPHDSFLWRLYEKGGHDFLISTNNDPWIKYVAVERKHREASPIFHGGLGGEYKLTDGTVYKTRTGWSSRASVINKYFKHVMPNEDLISEVTVKTPQGNTWAGFNLTYAKLEQLVRYYNCGGEKPIYIVTTEAENGEISLTPSIHPDKVVKPI